MINKKQTLSGFPPKPFIMKFKPVEKQWYKVKKAYRSLRVKKYPTFIFGPQYKRSRDCIEIDITYRCNLRCLNCNRSINKAPENLDISLAMIDNFVSDSLIRNIHWKRIRILGGEPTLHPHFVSIVKKILKYRDSMGRGNVSIEVVTNGHGSYVQKQLNSLPSDVYIENSKKTPQEKLKFRPFSWAPQDFGQYSNNSYVNGCQIMKLCGMGLTPMGYYPCAISGGIDRIAKKQCGRNKIPTFDDDMKDILEWACSLCGRFLDGHHIPQKLLLPLTEELISPSWVKLYQDWQTKK
ncbi:radical SAM protein [Desulfovibrio sp. UCD-KL4C]|uniref:radical SAM protein n=1 Tax=Desulfovibrio sp. UCD-KL4C TaxID=2578120 RepID=UPI0025B9FD64|nr:radical SAM protein [Desulfovibrio sp. UCD-KL4C]